MALLVFGFFLAPPLQSAYYAWQEILLYVEYGLPFKLINAVDGFGTHGGTAFIIFMIFTVIYWYFIAILIDFILSKIRKSLSKTGSNVV